MDCSIAVIVPVFNRATTILATLDSVAKQTLQPTELVVVDDGSTDASAACVSKWLSERTSRLHGVIVRQANRGVSAARNRGFAAARPSSLVAFLDSDDRWPSDFLERTSAALAGVPDAVAATCDREVYTEKGSDPELHSLARLAASPIAWMLDHGAGITSSTLFRAAAIERRGGFDETLETGEDTALFMPLSLDGPWLHVPGQPVAFDRALTGCGFTERNLSHKYRDNHRRWARVYENFICHGGGAVVSAAIYRPRLSRIWCRAGKELARGSNITEARECFRAALAWNPWNLKAWRHLAQCYLVRAVTPPVDQMQTVEAPFAIPFPSASRQTVEGFANPRRQAA